MTDSIAFNARTISTFTTDKLYRIFIVGSELCFVKIGGQGGLAEGAAAGLTSQFGLLGGLVGAAIGSAITTAAKKRQDANAVQADRLDPRTLATTGKDNFLATVRDVIKSSLDPPPIFGGHGKCFGRWQLHLRGDRKITLQFENIDDMKCAVENLPKVLAPRLQVNVQWDEKNQKYTGKKG